MSDAADRWASQPGPAKVLAAARELLEEQRAGDRVAVRLELTAPERAQIGRLLGVAWVASDKPATLGALRRALENLGDSLEGLLVRRGGALDDRPAQRARDAARAAAVVEEAYEMLKAAEIPPHAVELARRRHWLGRSEAGDLSARAAALVQIWNGLPVRPSRPPAPARPLSEFANAVAGGTHHLDRDAELGRLAARLLAAAAAEPPRAATAADQALYATQWRQTWAVYGITCDEVSATVLVWNLRLTGASAAAAITCAAADHGEPVWLTARSLRGDWRPDTKVVTVRVCENPAIVEAAADALGPVGQSLVCIYGRPSSAAWTLLRGLAAAEVTLLVTADRDSAGERFMTELLALPGAQQWLPDAVGVYEESRLAALVADLRMT